MNCPKCGSAQIDEVTIDQDEMGNDIRALICAKCDTTVAEQADAFDCLHINIEWDMIGRKWCVDCGDYLGER